MKHSVQKPDVILKCTRKRKKDYLPNVYIDKKDLWSYISTNTTVTCVKCEWVKIRSDNIIKINIDRFIVKYIYI